MPEWVEREVLARFLLDVPRTMRWMQRDRSMNPGG
jgi:hypothetical protein